MSKLLFLFIFGAIQFAFAEDLICHFKTSDWKEMKQVYICDISSMKYHPKSIPNNHSPQLGKSDDDVKVLDVWFVPLVSLPQSLMTRFPNSKSVSIVNVGLKEISRKDFKKLKSLRSLRLSSNKLQRLEKDTFDDLIMLKELLLSRNSIMRLFSGVFDKLRCLKTLDLSNNRLFELPGDLLQNNGKLERLYFGLNALYSIPQETFKNLASIEHINLEGNVCIDFNFQYKHQSAEFAKVLRDCANKTVAYSEDNPKGKGILNHMMFRMFFGDWNF